MNILSNAVKYTPEGGIVTIIMNTISITEDMVVDRYIIRDTGIGMSEEFLPHLFEAFSQEGRINTNRQEGTEVTILIDIRMPVLNGLQATKKIRSLDRLDAKTVPIIAMTANAFEDDIRKCFEAGMNEHLAKPFDTNVFYQTLARQIEDSSVYVR